jgi:hypothetical protein
MSLGFQDQKAERRRRWRLFKLLFVTAVLVGLGLAAYRTGTELAQQEAMRLRIEVDQLTTGIAALRDEKAELQQQVAAARLAETQWKGRYEAEVPTGKSRELLTLVDAQIAKGADPARIEFLLQGAANERNCDSEPVSKRFYVHTPFYAGPIRAATFAHNAVTGDVRGEAAVNAEGNAEGWFDPAKPVRVNFVQLGGGAKEVSGQLPLHHSVVRGDREYRFSIVTAERTGFVYVTADSCAFP